MIRYFVALGDSFTEGVGDPDPRISVGTQGLASLHDPASLQPPIPLRSAHDWIAIWMQAANPTLQYANLAERGLRVGEVRNQQMQRGLNLHPDFVSIIAGANDVLRGPFSAEGVRAELSLMFGAFQSTGARIFTATLPDFTLRLELPDGVRERLSRNLQTTNNIIRELAHQYGAIFYEFSQSGLENSAALWSEDGVHPNALGYLELAKSTAPFLQSYGIELIVPDEVKT